MPLNNTERKFLIEVSGIKGYFNKLPATFTTPYQVGEIVSGVDSGSTAKVFEVGVDYITVTEKLGTFYTEEPISGSLGGAGETTADAIIVSENLNDVGLNIVDGLWTINSTVSGVKFGDAVRSTNCDKGGSISYGNNFYFTVEDLGLSNFFTNNGVYYENSRIECYLDINDGNGWVQIWTGVLETAKASGDITIEFSCKGSVDENTAKMGSKEVPIAFNRNYNCKLVEKDKTKNIKNLTTVPSNLITIYEQKAFIDKVQPVNNNPHANYEIWILTTFTEAIEVNNGHLKVIGGVGSGSTFKIAESRYVESLTSDRTWLSFLIEGDASGLTTYGISGSVVEVYDMTYDFYLSKNKVSFIHENNLSNIRKPLTLRSDREGAKDLHLTKPECYDENLSFSETVVSLFGADEEGNVKNISSVGLNPESFQFVRNTGGLCVLSFSYSKDDLERIRKSLSDGETYLDGGIFRLNDFITGPDPFFIVDFKTIVLGNYNFAGNTQYPGQTYIPPTIITETTKLSNPTFNDENQPIKLYVDGTDFIIDMTNMINVGLDEFEVNKLNMDSTDHIQSIVTEFHIRPSSFSYDEDWDPALMENTEAKALFRNNRSADESSIGCSGENVQPGNEFESVTDTIKYAQTEYAGLPTSDIDEASYDQANDEFEFFPSNPAKNAAPQITSQIKVDTLLESFLSDYCLGMTQGRDGRWRLDNWLVRSAVFSDSTPNVVFEDFISIGKIKKSSITEVISDFELNWDYSEAEGEYKRNSRIFNTSRTSFDFDECVEGIDRQYEYDCKEVWELLAAGRARVKRETQFVYDTKNIKANFSDSTGDAEALFLMRSLSGLFNRQLEKIEFEVDLNNENITRELLEFVGFKDIARTNDEVRNGWITDINVSFEKGIVIFELLLDIDPKDPLLVQSGIIQDDALAVDEIEDDVTVIEILEDS